MFRIKLALRCLVWSKKTPSTWWSAAFCGVSNQRLFSFDIGKLEAIAVFLIQYFEPDAED